MQLRKRVGAANAYLVLRTGGTAALTYGEGNTGVAETTLYRQRSAVAAASVAHAYECAPVPFADATWRS